MLYTSPRQLADLLLGLAYVVLWQGSVRLQPPTRT